MNKNLVYRWCIFSIGMIFVALSIALFVKCALGTTPIASVAYVLSLALPYTVGEFNFLVSFIVFVLQIVILGKKFKPIQFLQIPITFVFCALIDFFGYTLSWLHPQMYIEQFIVMLLGCLAMGIGVTLEVKGNVIMLPCEAFVNSIVIKWKFNFGKVKMAFDWSLVLIAAIFSMYYFGEVRGIREGTLISAFSTGILERIFIYMMAKVKAKQPKLACK